MAEHQHPVKLICHSEFIIVFTKLYLVKTRRRESSYFQIHQDLPPITRNKPSIYLSIYLSIHIYQLYLFPSIHPSEYHSSIQLNIYSSIRPSLHPSRQPASWISINIRYINYICLFPFIRISEHLSSIHPAEYLINLSTTGVSQKIWISWKKLVFSCNISKSETFIYSRFITCKVKHFKSSFYFDD